MPYLVIAFGFGEWFAYKFEIGTQGRCRGKNDLIQSNTSNENSKFQSSEPENAPSAKCINMPISNIDPVLLAHQFDREPAGETLTGRSSTEPANLSDAGPDPSLKMTAIQQLSCPLFSKLPTEIRFMIYKQLLISRSGIENAHKYLGPNLSLLSIHNVRPYGISSTILRTCQLIYDEARPILYKNRFRFREIDDMGEFARAGLVAKPSTLIYGFQQTVYGRLTELTSLSLCLGTRSSFIISSERKHLIEHWHGFFNNRRCWDPVAFPSLRKLRLDFTKWQLTEAEEDSLTVSAIVKRFELSGKLQKLVVKGVMHEQNLRDLKDGFVEPGGKFLAVDALGVRLCSVTSAKDGDKMGEW